MNKAVALSLALTAGISLGYAVNPITDEYKYNSAGDAVKVTGEIKNTAYDFYAESIEFQNTAYANGGVTSDLKWLWHLDALDNQSSPYPNGSYTYAKSGKGVTVYFVDSGINSNHDEFSNLNITHQDFTGDSGDNYGRDCVGHGTAMASLMAGKNYGVAKDVNIVAFKLTSCSDKDGIMEDAWIKSLEWIRDNHTGNTAILNMSLGFEGNNPRISNLVSQVLDKGVILTTSAGNDSTDACRFYPASEARAITVGAVTPAYRLAGFSNDGSCVDIWAPGDEVIAADWQVDNGSIMTGGTSAAAPMVAGVIAMYLESNPQATIADATAWLKDNAFDASYSLYNRTEAGTAKVARVIPSEYAGNKPTLKTYVKSGNLTASVTSIPEAGKVDYLVYNSKGKLVKKITNSTKMKVSFKGLAKGKYKITLKVKATNSVYSSTTKAFTVK